MSIKLTTQMDWVHYASFSRYHPDNLERTSDLALPKPVVGPPPVTELTEVDKKLNGAWGHKLCCERAYAQNETTTRIKDSVSPKVGSNWLKTIHIEKSNSAMCSAMYGGSLVEPTFSELVNSGAKKT